MPLLPAVFRLAAIGFSDPVMLVGMLAGAIPIALHLLNRIRSPIVPFPTLRFLKITALKTSRRRQLQQWFLLFLRVALFGLVAMAIAQPLIGGGSAALAYGLIACFLIGAGLLVLATVYGASALDQSKSRASSFAANTTSPANTGELSPSRPPPAGRSWAWCAAMLILGVVVLAYASFGLASDRFFTAQTGRYSGRSTACVIILDNSHSMLARQDSRSRWQLAAEQVRQLLADNIAPAEVAILPTNPGESSLPDRLSPDTTSALGTVEKLQTLGRSRPTPQLVEHAIKLLRTSNQPHKMLVLITDFARPAFSSPDVFSAVKEAKPPILELQVVLMPQSSKGAPNDVGITRFAVAAGPSVLGAEVTFEAEVINSGDAAVVRELALLMDDKPVTGISPSPRVQLGPGGNAGRAALKFPLRLTAPGSHRFTLKLQDSGDALAWDDQRELILNVAGQIKALVVGATETPSSRSAARFVLAALDPYRGVVPASAGGTAPWAIAPVYRGSDRLGTEPLAPYAAIFMCDVPQLSPATATALNRYVSAGHRLVWILGPTLNTASYNQPATSMLLPNNLEAPVISALGSPVDWIDSSAGVLSNLFDSQEPFHSIVVTGRWSLPHNAANRGQAIAKLADGSPLLIRQALGRGEIYTFLTTPAADWSTLASTVPFLPIMNRMALGDPARGGANVAPASYDPGQLVELPLPSEAQKLAVDVQTPSGTTMNVPAPGNAATAGIPSDVPAEPRWPFTHTLATGVYRWQSTDRKYSGQFVVNPPGDEADLVPFDVETLAHDASPSRPDSAQSASPAIVAPTVAELLARLDKLSEGYSLMPGVLALVMILLILEALLANRHRPALRPLQRTGALSDQLAGDSAVTRSAA